MAQQKIQMLLPRDTSCPHMNFFIQLSQNYNNSETDNLLFVASNYQVCGTKVIGWEILAFTREPHRADLTGTGPLGP